MSEKSGSKPGNAGANTKWMQWARNQPLKSPEKGVLRALAWIAGLPGGVYPSFATIAFDEGISERCAKDCVARLEHLGLIAVRRVRLPSGRSGNNTYFLNAQVTVTAEEAAAAHSIRAGKQPSARGAPGTLSAGLNLDQGASVAPSALEAVTKCTPCTWSECTSGAQPSARGAHERVVDERGVVEGGVDRAASRDLSFDLARLPRDPALVSEAERQRDLADYTKRLEALNGKQERTAAPSDSTGADKALESDATMLSGATWPRDEFGDPAPMPVAADKATMDAYYEARRLRDKEPKARGTPRFHLLTGENLAALKATVQRRRSA